MVTVAKTTGQGTSWKGGVGTSTNLEESVRSGSPVRKIRKGWSGQPVKT